MLSGVADLAKRAHAGYCLNAANAGADRLFLRDEEETDVAGAVAVRPTAQLTARASLDHAHLVVVLLSEQRHRTGRERLLQRHHARVDVGVREDRAVHLVLDALELVRR